MQTIKIVLATVEHTEILALLGRTTYIESHGHFIEEKTDLNQYVNKTFQVSRIEQEIQDPMNIYLLIYVDALPVGYSKLIMQNSYEKARSNNSCRLDKIYILNEFIPLKLGLQLLKATEEKARSLQVDEIWLSVYIKNQRAIRFYQKNAYKSVGEIDFLVNGTNYENYVFSKKLSV